MADKKIELTKDLLLGKGNNRECYVSPKDSYKVIKISISKKSYKNQNIIEDRYYKYLEKNKISQEHIVKCYGYVDTNLGKGLVFEKIVNYDGTMPTLFSKVLLEKRVLNTEDLDSLIEELKKYIFNNEILFIDVATSNIFVQEIKKDKFKLIIFDGLGGISYFRLLMCLYSKWYKKRAIKKAWSKFLKNIENKLK
ncbi:YrbL family protein [Aliarcobacter cryaerophilus]|uniref:YrbL family protein n=1 Tax=Aliarcobacter cryaerophilus TaxID=28198 RepID=UPI003DA406E2